MKYAYIALIITFPCAAMEKEKTICPEITAVKNPHQAFFITNNQAVINGEGGCSIVHLQNNKEIKKISDSDDAYLAMHPDKSVFALAHSDRLYIYDAHTGILRCDSFQLKLPNVTSAVFNHSQDIFLSSKNYNGYYITRFIHAKNYYNPPVNETIIDSLIPCNHMDHDSFLTNIICHPTHQELICLICSATGHISIKNIDSLFVDDNLHRSQLNRLNGKHLNGAYSPDGSILACYNPATFFIIDINTGEKEMLLKIANKGMIRAITFHPEGSIITALSNKEEVTNIDYWDIKNKKIIMSTPLPEVHNTHNAQFSLINPFSWFTTKENNQINPSLSFSPDQKNLMVIMKNKCFLIPVSFEIRYRTDIKERILLYWLLKNCNIDDNPVLPKELIQTITHIFLETLQR